MSFIIFKGDDLLVIVSKIRHVIVLFMSHYCVKCFYHYGLCFVLFSKVINILKNKRSSNKITKIVMTNIQLIPQTFSQVSSLVEANHFQHTSFHEMVPVGYKLTLIFNTIHYTIIFLIQIDSYHFSCFLITSLFDQIN